MSLKSGQIHYQGVSLSLWDSFGLKDFPLRSGGFCEDSRGRDTNAAKNLLARGWALMADLGFCQIAIAGEAKTVETAMNEGVGASTIAGAGHGPLEVGVPFHVASSNLEGEDVNDVSQIDEVSPAYFSFWVANAEGRY